MADVKCSELAALVERLAGAINHAKRLQADNERTPEEQLQADATVNEVLQAVRTHKAEHQCEQTEVPSSAG